MYAQKGVTSGGVFYKQPYSIVGGGAGAWHQGYGPMIYESYEIPQHLGPSMFAPPSGYTQITNTQKLKGGEIMVKENCSICHITESGPTTLYAPPEPPKPSRTPPTH
jgi:hypothetical protein